MTSHQLMSKQSWARQQGAVLVMAVFFTTIIAGIAVGFIADFQLRVAKARQVLVATQLQQLLYSVEDYAAWSLIEDGKADDNNSNYGKQDHLQEDWINSLKAPVDEAEITANLEDALSRFNLNQLQGKPNPYNPNGTLSTKFTVPQQRFFRLLQTHPDGIIDTAQAQAITEAVIDWVDTDDAVTGLGGAENNYYQSLENAHRATNGFFVSITELRQIKGITPEIYDFLSPLVVALPGTQGFNVNTASPYLIRSLNQKDLETPLSEEDVALLIGSRPQQKEEGEEEIITSEIAEPFATIDDFLNSSGAIQLFGVDPAFWPSTEGLHTGSEYFILHASASLLEHQRQQTSLMKREKADTGIKAKVLQRTRDIL